MKLYKKTFLYVKQLQTPVIQPLIQGSLYLYAQESGLIYDYHLKAISFFLKKRLKGYSKLYTRISLNKYVTKKPIGIRMGKGKGAIDKKYLYLNQGTILFEIRFLKSKEDNIEKLNWLKKLVFCVNRKSPIQIKLGKI